MGDPCGPRGVRGSARSGRAGGKAPSSAENQALTKCSGLGNRLVYVQPWRAYSRTDKRRIVVMLQENASAGIDRAPIERTDVSGAGGRRRCRHFAGAKPAV